MIRLYWYRLRPRPNFGDEISRLICEELSGQRVEYAPLSRADLIATGSLLARHLVDMEWKNYRGAVWGTGCMVAGETIPLFQADVKAVRGYLSAAQMVSPTHSSIHFGDPGLLANRLLTRKPNVKTLIGIVPHWSELQHPFFAAPFLQRADVKLINPLHDAREVIEEIASCQFILSSSLHGLVVADAFAIPNRWLRLYTGQENRAGAPEFKFRDYYSVYGLAPIQPLNAKTISSIGQLIPLIENWGRPRLEAIQEELYKCFPFR